MAERETRWAERGAIKLPLTLTISAEFAKAEGGRGDERTAASYLPITAMAIEAVTARLLGDVDRSRKALGRHIRSLGESRGSESGESERRETFSLDDLLWEISDRHGFHDAFVIELVDENLRAALAGQFYEFQVGYWANQIGTHPALRLACVFIEFEQGSLKTKLKLIGAPTAFVLTLAVSLGSLRVGEDWFEQRRVVQEVASTYNGETCMLRTELGIDGKVLLDAMASELNFNASGLSPVERARAVCLVQLSLDLSGYPVGPIDGIYGPTTEKQLRAFAGSKGYKDANDPSVIRLLVRALDHGARALAKK